MKSGNYVPIFNISSNGGYVALFSTSKGGETAGSVANNISSSSIRTAYIGGETAGSVASSSSGGFSSGGCSYTAIA